MTVRERYDKLKHEFSDVYESIREFEVREYIEHFWEGRREDTVALHLLPVPPFDFLQRPVIRSTMNAGSKLTGPYLAELEKGWHHNAKWDHLSYDALGKPEADKYMGKVPKFKGDYMDWGTIKQAYALMVLGQLTSFSLSRVRSIVEWGGGYGRMAAILHKKLGRKLTYVGIDLPLMCTLQWLYLSCLFGEEWVNLVDDPEKQIVKGKLNLVPTAFIETTQPQGEVFIALNSLNECSRTAWEDVARYDWFGSQYRLMRYPKAMVEFTDFLHTHGMPSFESNLTHKKFQFVCWEAPK